MALRANLEFGLFRALGKGTGCTDQGTGGSGYTGSGADLQDISSRHLLAFHKNLLFVGKGFKFQAPCADISPQETDYPLTFPTMTLGSQVMIPGKNVMTIIAKTKMTTKGTILW